MTCCTLYLSKQNGALPLMVHLGIYNNTV